MFRSLLMKLNPGYYVNVKGVLEKTLFGKLNIKFVNKSFINNSQTKNINNNNIIYISDPDS